jgi:hypothetical protein
LVAGASAAGSWCAAVGLPELGLIGLEEMGADLSRLALVPSPGTAFAAAVAALLDSVDLVLVSTRETVRPGDARRLAARARERGTVLVPLESLRPELRLAAPVRPPAREERVAGQPTDGPERGGRRWPGPIDLRLVPLESEWRGLGQGHGHLRGRRVEIEVSGRGAATRPRRGWLWLPSPDGTVREASPVRAVGSQRQLPRLEAAGAG